MHSQTLPARSTASLRWPPRSPLSDGVDAPPLDSKRDAWMSAFVGRFAELQPLEEEDALFALAADLFEDVGRHDPLIAAEMEHEVGAAFD